MSDITVNALNALTWSDYERLLTARYQAGGHTRETARRFAQPGNPCQEPLDIWEADSPGP